MSNVSSHASASAEQLLAERDAVLAEMPFRQSPTLVRLLRYLVDRAIVDPSGKVTQYDIAVEAMGKAHAFDFGNESYARVMVSRLRKALAQHYAANTPVDGLCLHVPKGIYSIALAAPEEAYPELAGGKTSTPRRDSAPAGDAQTEKSEAARARFRAPGTPVAMAIIALLAIVVAAGIAAALSGWRQQADAGLTMSPLVEVVVDDEASSAEAAASRPVAELARTMVTSSLVGRLARDEPGDYVLAVATAGTGNETAVSIVLEDRAGNLISSAEYPIDPDDPAIPDQARAFLIDIFRPSGILTDAVLGRIDREKPRSAYECYIAFDLNRVVTVDSDAVDECVARFGDDRIHLPNIIARNAFSLYVQDLRAGGEVRSEGKAWAEVQRAQRHGDSSLYTSVLLTRIDFAEGRCDRGLHRMNRLNKRIEVFPSLQAMMLTDGIPCMTDPAERERARQEIQKLVSYNIDAAPILRAYLVLASLEAGDVETARATLREHRTGTNLDRSLDTFYRTLGQALSGGPYDPEQLRRVVQVFVWNDAARATIIRTVAADAQQVS